MSTDQKDTGIWEIWIDDVVGELAMNKNDLARRKLEVVEKEVFDALVKERDDLRAKVEELESIKVPGRLEAQLKEKGQEIKRLREALQGIIEIGKRDLSNSKYDSYFDAAKEALLSTEKTNE